MFRYLLIFLASASLVGCDASKTKSAETSPSASSTASGTTTVSATITASAEPKARPTTKLKSSPAKVIQAVNPKVVLPSTGRDQGQAIVTTLMETMIRRDIDSARSLFPRPEFLAKHFPGKDCEAFRNKVLSNQKKLFPASRAWVRESIARILHPKEWKDKLGEMKDEIATSLDLRIAQIKPVSEKVTSLGDTLSNCKAAADDEGKRFRATYDAAILGKRGKVNLDGEVMNLAKQGWFVVGY